jgi:hypothetical protein
MVTAIFRRISEVLDTTTKGKKVGGKEEKKIIFRQVTGTKGNRNRLCRTVTETEKKKRGIEGKREEKEEKREL